MRTYDVTDGVLHRVGGVWRPFAVTAVAPPAGRQRAARLTLWSAELRWATVAKAGQVRDAK